MKRYSPNLLVGLAAACLLLLTGCLETPTTASDQALSPAVRESLKTARGHSRDTQGTSATPSSTSMEKASQKAIDYLAKTQNPDGSWGKGPTCRVGLTSLAMIAYFADGQTPSSERYGETVLNGFGKLLAYAEERSKTPSPATLWEACENGMLLWALSDAYSLTRLSRLEEPAAALLKKIVADESYLGLYKDKTENDFFVMAFCTFGIRSFWGSGNKGYPDLEKLVGQLKAALKKDYVLADGTFSRKKGGNSSDFTATCLGTYCLLLVGERASSLGQKNLKRILESKFPDSKTLELDWSNPSDGEWAILAFFALHGVIWEERCGTNVPQWKAMRQELIRISSFPCEAGHFPIPIPEKTLTFLPPSDASLWTASLFIPLLVCTAAYYPHHSFPPSHSAEGDSPARADDLGITIE